MGAIGWVDADTFYCNAERARYPMLRNIPLGVLGNNGACIIARTAELKQVGIRVGDPIWEGKIRCPDAVFLKRDFDWLGDVSGRMLEEIRNLSPLVEYFSIDEMGFAAEPIRGSYGRAAETVRGRIKEGVGVPATTGIARTRTLAKLLCDAIKPFGAAAVLSHSEEESLLASHPVSDLCGIGSRRAASLAECGITTCLDLANADRRLVRRLLTATGEALWWELRGEPVIPIHGDRLPHKVLARGGSFGEATDKPSVIFAWLVRNLERLIEELYYHEVKTDRITVWVAYRNGEARLGRASLPAPSDRFDILLDAARPCLRRAWLPRVAANRMHLVAERLIPRAHTQLSLFGGGDPRAEAVARIKREINERRGRFAIRSGATLPLYAIYRDAANSYDICEPSSHYYRIMTRSDRMPVLIQERI